MSTLPVDVVVAGAGPAGCALSALLGRAGHRVLLVDQGRMPRPRLCTHAMMPSAVPMLADLGVLDAVERAGAVRWWGVTLDIDGTRIAADLPRRGVATPYGLSLRRPLLDPILFDAAQSSPGVRVQLGARVLGPLRNGHAVHGVAMIDEHGERQEVRARLVVAADGRRSGLVSALGLPALTLPNRHVATIAYIAGLPPEPYPRLEAIHESGRSLSLLPADGGLHVAGLIAPPDRATVNPAAFLAALLHFSRLRPHAHSLRVASRPAPVRGLRLRVHLAAVPGLVPLGDAAIQTDPAFGQGIAWALRGAGRLADRINAILAAPGDGPLTLSIRDALEPVFPPLLFAMAPISAVPPASTAERTLMAMTRAAPAMSTLALRFAAGFAAAPPRGVRRSPSTFLKDVLRPLSGSSPLLPPPAAPDCGTHRVALGSTDLPNHQ